MILTGLCIGMLALKYLQLGHRFLMFLGWNLFLAWVPLIALYLVAYFQQKRKRVISVVFWIIWLFFYPNAPYLLTDVIHVPDNWAIWSNTAITIDILAWYNIVLLLLSVWVGILLTFHALYPVHQWVVNKLGQFIGFMFSVLLSLISGYGVYLGRFERFNSWDILHRPMIIYDTIKASMNLTTLSFVLLFGGLIFVIYNSLYALERR